MKIKLDTDSFSIIRESPQIREVFDIVGRAASSQSTVMIYGESGTGKELIARALHLNSQRASKPFIAVNCAAIPHDLLESELFGYEKGSFTGAVNNRIGRIELANQGTIFLDEIGDMPPVLQVKLLRVLAERDIAPLPDAAETSESEEAELEAVEELLSSFAQPRRIRLIDISIVARKLYVLLMMPPNKSLNLEMRINKISFTSFTEWTNESVFSHSK